MAGSCIAENSDDYSCELLLGNWSGEYELADGTIYRFDSALDEDGSIMVDFDYYEIGQRSRHEGSWLCENNILTTSMLTSDGGFVMYQYLILEIDESSMSYRDIYPGVHQNSFYSVRVGAQPMFPEIFRDS